MEACFLQISNRKYETIHFFQRDLGLTPRQLYVSRATECLQKIRGTDYVVFVLI